MTSKESPSSKMSPNSSPATSSFINQSNQSRQKQKPNESPSADNSQLEKEKPVDPHSLADEDDPSNLSSKLEKLTVDNPEDLDIFVKELLDGMQTRFTRLSDIIMGRIDDMGTKIDELEQNINDLMKQVGVESPNDLGDTKRLQSQTDNV